MKRESIQKELHFLADEKYRDFSRKLIPGTDYILGVPIPVLRKFAKKTAQTDFRPFLYDALKNNEKNSSHEEILFLGLLLGYVQMDVEEREKCLNLFVPKIHNWAQCDSCTAAFRFMREKPDYWFSYLETYQTSTEEFTLRFMIVSMMTHFMDENHIDKILNCCKGIHHDGYYVKMGNAWAVSMCYLSFPEKTKNFLEGGHLDYFTHNKAIQKIRESRKVSPEEKEMLNKLKRKKNDPAE